MGAEANAMTGRPEGGETMVPLSALNKALEQNYGCYVGLTVDDDGRPLLADDGGLYLLALHASKGGGPVVVRAVEGYD